MPPTPEILDALVSRAAAGDRSALESLLLHFHDPLLARIHSTLAARGVTDFSAEDVLQEAFLEAFRKAATIEPRGHRAFFAWLKTIADSRLSNQLRAGRALKRGGLRKRLTGPAPGNALESTAVSILGYLAGKDPTPSRIARKKETLLALTRCLEDLEPLRRRVVHLRFGKGMSVEEVAAEIDRSQGAVKMLINRAIKDLRSSISAELGDLSAGA